MNILLIDDNRYILKLVEDYLKKFEVEVTSFNNSPDALLYFQKNFTHIDLIITDIMMPEINGIDLCEKLKNIDPSIHILAITAGGNGQGNLVKGVIHREVMTSGAEAVLQKPFDLIELENAINKVIRAA